MLRTYKLFDLLLRDITRFTFQTVTNVLQVVVAQPMCLLVHDRTNGMPEVITCCSKQLYLLARKTLCLYCQTQLTSTLAWAKLTNPSTKSAMSVSDLACSMFASRRPCPASNLATQSKAIAAAAGNAMSVPVVGACLARVLNTLAFAGVLEAAPRPDRDLVFLETFARKRKLADDIARLDGEAVKYAQATAKLSRIFGATCRSLCDMPG